MYNDEVYRALLDDLRIENKKLKLEIKQLKSDLKELNPYTETKEQFRNPTCEELKIFNDAKIILDENIKFVEYPTFVYKSELGNVYCIKDYPDLSVLKVMLKNNHILFIKDIEIRTDIKNDTWILAYPNRKHYLIRVAYFDKVTSKFKECK